jgi:hypothetical protein
VEYAMEAVRQPRQFSDSDTDVVTWSPVGWLYHLEYAATEAVKQRLCGYFIPILSLTLCSQQ